ncbi:MAG TPA: GNAT family protein [bacterium]|nr:GNAT family protein [bacterium]
MSPPLMQIEPVVLRGNHVLLEPLQPGHTERFCQIGLEGDVFRWFPLAMTSPEHMRDYVAAALRDQAQGSALPFATVHRGLGQAVGSTRFMAIDRPNRRVEIGSTWIGKPWQRSAVNTEAKFLMLRHAFEVWGCLRVELKTDSLNAASRRAILRIGAQEEGTLRNHMLTAAGRVRHSVYFSVIQEEWPQVKARLERMLAEHGAPGQS